MLGNESVVSQDSQTISDSADSRGIFRKTLRVMAVDGTVLDVPDSAANARVFGYPGSRKGTRAAFPKVRLVLLIEAGTHLIVDALIVLTA